MSEPTPSREAQRSRQTAMEAERHWWATRLITMATRWRNEAREEQRVSFGADEIERLIAERTK